MINYVFHNYFNPFETHKSCILPLISDNPAFSEIIISLGTTQVSFRAERGGIIIIYDTGMKAAP
jgi:hypothetical protein